MVEMIKMSSRGQIVIPQHIRENLGAGEGSVFAVLESNDSVILKKIQPPSKEEILRNLQAIAGRGSKRAEKLGIKEKDVPELIHKLRASKR